MRIFRYFLNYKIGLILSLFLSCISYGETKTFSAKDIQSIKVEGIKIKVFFKHTNSKNFKIKLDKPFSVKIKKTVLEIKDPSYKNKNSWKSFTFFSKKERTLRITGPSKPVSIFSAHLWVDFSKWKSSVFISSYHSKILGNKNKNSWDVFSKESNLNLNHHEGDINFKGFSLNAVLKNFSKTKSHFYFNDGLLKVAKGSGDIFFTVDRAKIDIKNFTGNLVGTTRSGPVNVSIKTDKIVDVFSQEGEVRFYSKKMGVKFFAYTEKGKIYAPRHMHKEYSGKSIKVTGRMKGKKQGKTSLRTNTGNIYAY